jgi:hypothetical protein
MSQTQVCRGVNTNVRSRDGKIICTYHQTDVVAVDAVTITLRNGGYETATTKLRMNQMSNQFELGYQVWQKNFEWFVDYKGKTIPFEDGMVLARV